MVGNVLLICHRQDLVSRIMETILTTITSLRNQTVIGMHRLHSLEMALVRVQPHGLGAQSVTGTALHHILGLAMNGELHLTIPTLVIQQPHIPPASRGMPSEARQEGGATFFTVHLRLHLATRHIRVVKLDMAVQEATITNQTHRTLLAPVINFIGQTLI